MIARFATPRKSRGTRKGCREQKEVQAQEAHGRGLAPDALRCKPLAIINWEFKPILRGYGWEA